MANFKATITKKALSVLAEISKGVGKSLIFTKFQVGEGIKSSSDDATKFESLINPIIDVPITHYAILSDGVIEISGQISNENLKARLHIFEYAIFAIDPSTQEEFLYNYVYTDVAEWLPPPVNSIEHCDIGIITTIGEASKVEFVINKTYVYPTLENFEDFKNNLTLDLSNHTSNNIVHITSTERSNFNDKYTKNEIDNKFSILETAIDWKESVNTFADIAKTYPNPQDGWTVNTKDTDYTYRYNGSKWVAISANSIPKATKSVDGLMSKEVYAKLDTIEEKANNYTHPQTHPASIIIQDSTHRFVADTEKSNWSNKYTKNEIDNKFSALETAIDWKESVNTFSDIAKTYPNPQDGWTVNTKDTDYTYRYNGNKWVVISANAIPKATKSVDGLMSKEAYSELENVSENINTILVGTNLSNATKTKILFKVV